MKTQYRIVTLVLLLVLSEAASAELRVWTSLDRKQQVNAELVQVRGSVVELKLENGSTVTIPLRRFSPEDRAYVREAKRQDKASEPVSETEPTTSMQEDPQSAADEQREDDSALETALARLASDELAKTSCKLAQQSGMSIQHGLPVIFLDHFINLEDLPVRERTNRYKAAEQAFETQQRNFGKFLDRVAIGLDQDCMAEYLPTLIAYHFPREVAAELIESRYQTGGAIGIWKGKDEFERRSSKEKFEKEYQEELADLAIKTPFRICFVSEASFSAYDFVREGLVVGAKNKGGEARLPGYTWKEAVPYLPSAGYFNKKLNIANLPVAGTSFWSVSPDIVAKLPSRSRRSRIGPERITRWAYVATVVSFRSPTLLPRSEREMPALVGEVESVGLYAQPTLKTHLHDFELERYSSPVMMESATEADEPATSPAPFDEFALAGLLAEHDDVELHEQVWRDLWNHTATDDQQRYRSIEDHIKKYNEQINGHAVQVNAENRTARQEEYLQTLRKELEEKSAEIARQLHPPRRPFLPPFVAETGGRAWEVDGDRLDPERSKALTSWLTERCDRLKGEFRLTLKLTKNPRTDEPTLRSMDFSPNLVSLLKEAKRSPEQVIALDENLYFNQIGELEPDGTRTGLFRISGMQYRPYQFLLNIGTSPEVLARSLPQEIVQQSLSQKPGEDRLAVFLDVKVNSIQLPGTSSGSGTESTRPVVLFDVTPTKMSAGESGKPLLFEAALSTEGLRETAANKPKKPIPMATGSDGTPLPITPQNLMPLMIKTTPDLLNDEEFVDQLMVMRWRFENASLFGVMPDGINFFDKGSRQVPGVSKRKERAEEFKAWLREWADAVPKQFAWRVAGSAFRFEGPIKDRPSPAMLIGSDHSKWTSVNAPQLWHVTYALQNPDRLPADMNAEEAKELLDQFAVPSPYVCLDTQFAIPNMNGETHAPAPQNANAIPGLPSPKYVEPIFPLFQFDKVIWPQKDATLSPASQKPELEIVGEMEPIKIEDKLPPHHWLDAFWKFQRSAAREDQLQDRGRYAIMPVKLKTARLVDPANGNTVLSLELQNYRGLTGKSAEGPERE